ncbi:Glycosyl transferase, family 2 [Arcticibacter svalbardensis MN12-7]|uniref:Glycosyl transferase, family 2 n=1 Tax=Arcticibacter svalbardensis MN12-7 TaxID=1150600 RepID=R9GMZ3_9SPHI|nr:glycosyltransferase family 2 protein [Arcticibacter svalbardensis]EOR92915.1 Glycosyl transferase, family 2 [Arcticibacter svalbardensis MN12-7]
MMEKPTISILTPVWNGLPYIKECIESVLIQDFTDWELLVSDNGSTDGTRDYLDSLNDPRIRIFKQEENVGIMGNINFLFIQANASISQILCADDYFTSSTSLYTIVKYWEHASPEIGFVRFNHTETKNSICRIIDLENRIVPPILESGTATLWLFVFGNIPGNLSNVSLRTQLVADIGYFNQNLPAAGDFEFWSRAISKVSMGIQNESTVYIRRHDNVASNYLSQKGEFYLQHIIIYKYLIKELESHYDRKKLIAYFNYEICSYHYRNAIKSALHGRFGYLKTMLETKSSITWSKWLQVTACLPFALFNGHQKLTIHMAEMLINHQQKQLGVSEHLN